MYGTLKTFHWRLCEEARCGDGQNCGITCGNKFFTVSFLMCVFGTLDRRVYIASQLIHLYPHSSSCLGVEPFS